MPSILEIINTYKKAISNIDANISNIQDVTSVYAQKTNVLKQSFNLKLAIYEKVAAINTTFSKDINQQLIVIDNQIDALFFRKSNCSHYAFIDLNQDLIEETDPRIINRLQKQIQICAMQIELQQINIDIFRHKIIDLATNTTTPLELANTNIERRTAENICQQLFDRTVQHTKAVVNKKKFINSPEYKAISPIDQNLLTQELVICHAILYGLYFKKFFAGAVLKNLQKLEKFDTSKAVIASTAFAKYIDMCVRYYCNPQETQHCFILNDEVWCGINQTNQLLQFSEVSDEIELIDLLGLNIAKQERQDGRQKLLNQLQSRACLAP